MRFEDLTPATLESFLVWQRMVAIVDPDMERWCPGFTTASNLADVQHLCQTVPGFEAWSLENLAAYLRLP